MQVFLWKQKNKDLDWQGLRSKWEKGRKYMYILGLCGEKKKKKEYSLGGSKRAMKTSFWDSLRLWNVNSAPKMLNYIMKGIM